MKTKEVMSAETRALRTVIVVMVSITILAFLLYQFYQHAMFMAWQHAPTKTLEPHPAIQIFDGSAPFFIWKCDKSFSIEFDNGFVIDASTRMNKLPKEWRSKSEFPVNGGEIDVKDENDDYQFTATIGIDYKCTELTTARHLKAAIKNLHSGKTMRLDHCTTEQLDYFFRTAAK